MIYEHKSQPVISRRAFLGRVARSGGHAAVLVAVSVLIGMAGYHWIAAMSWTDSFLNASMLLGGMGPIGDLPNAPAKLFAGFFALYAGLVFLVAAALLLTPVFHRVLHHFHLERSHGAGK